eukprot:Seg626.6 transcript_id=Seg626.6/GoldUCD/mRNA.D3Y31 product="BAG family molecular chaperone regulator 1" protein_id=Seg626.6/GoldUCD/D3Y31
MADGMGANNSSKSELDDDAFEGFLVHGSAKYRIGLPSLQSTLRELSELTFEVTKVPSSRQRLIYKGKSLTKIDSSLAENGLKNGAKIMLIGRKNDPVEDQLISNIEKVEKEVTKTENKFRDLITDFESLLQGFLETEMTKESLNKLEKQLKQYDGELMKEIERLDCMEIDMTYQEPKAKRKLLIKKIQKLHDEADEMERKIKDYRSENSL